MMEKEVYLNLILLNNSINIQYHKFSCWFDEPSYELDTITKELSTTLLFD